MKIKLIDRITWFIMGSVYIGLSIFLGWLFFQVKIPPTPEGFISTYFLGKVAMIFMIIGFVSFGIFILEMAFEKDE